VKPVLTHRITSDVTLFSDSIQIPGIGYLPVNTFVLHSTQPVVDDTGLSTPDKDYLSDLSQVIDAADVQWIWLTHNVDEGKFLDSIQTIRGLDHQGSSARIYRRRSASMKPCSPPSRRRPPDPNLSGRISGRWKRCWRPSNRPRVRPDDNKAAPDINIPGSPVPRDR